MDYIGVTNIAETIKYLDNGVNNNKFVVIDLVVIITNNIIIFLKL